MIEIKELTMFDCIDRFVKDLDAIQSDFCDNFCKYAHVEEGVPICMYEGLCPMEKIGVLNEK